MNADPYISIEARPFMVKVGKYAKIICVAGNAGNDSIAKGSLRIVISCGTNARITGIEKESGWKVNSVSKEKTANSIVLTNTRAFSSFDLGYVFARIRGVNTVIDSQTKRNIPQTITANTTYWTAYTDGKLNASQGNASNTNDNSTTSLIVT